MRFRWAIFLLCIVRFGIPTAHAQYMATPQLSGIGLPYFSAEVFPTFTTDGQQTLVRVFIQMVNDDITFIQADTGYTAEIQLEVYVMDAGKEVFFNRSIQKRLWVGSFEETNSRTTMNTFTIDIPIESGEYEAVITVLDKNTNKQVNRKIHFKMPDYRKYQFMISNVLFLNRVVRDSTGRIVGYEPNLTRNYSGDEKDIYFFFNTFVENPQDTLRIDYRVYDEEGRLDLRNQYLVFGEPPFQEHFIRLNRYQFDRNKYSLYLEAVRGDKKFQLNQIFSFFWTVTPQSPRDLDMATEQLVYIFEEDSIRRVLKRTYREKKVFFERFWEEMDPNPETEKNELMDEYYRRVNFANQNFSTMTQAGWLTDRGRIFIKFGEPDDIERHPFEIDSYPYEIWRYYQLRKVFLFIDRTGFGDYYLHPSFYNEEFN